MNTDMQKKLQYLDDIFSILQMKDEIIQIYSQPEIFISKDKFLKFKELIGDFIKQHGNISMNQCRDLLNTTRKYSVPFMEYLDSTGFTRRTGDVRVLKHE